MAVFLRVVPAGVGWWGCIEVLKCFRSNKAPYFVAFLIALLGCVLKNSFSDGVARWCS